jgi:hypoxanthine phosphoribosyltransferase
MPKKIQIKAMFWDNTDLSYQTLIEILANDIQFGIEKEHIRFDYIVGVPRGGLIPAVSLSHILDIPMTTIQDEAIFSSNVLFVDDVCHSGETFKKLRKDFDNPTLIHQYCAVVKNSLTTQELWKYAMEANKNEWVSFPWEMPLTKQELNKKIKKHIG